MMRRLVRSVVQSATITGANAVSLKIDPLILRAAEILPLEEVEVVNRTTGDRLTTFVEPAEEGSGAVLLNGFRAGDTVTIVSYGMMHDGQTIGHRARVVTLDPQNVVVAVDER